MARLLDGVSVPAEKFDQHPFLLNVKNGTLDLRTGELRPPAPDDLLTQAMAKS
jgi:putative DNA primase/helicase